MTGDGFELGRASVFAAARIPFNGSPYAYAVVIRSTARSAIA